MRNWFEIRNQLDKVELGQTSKEEGEDWVRARESMGEGWTTAWPQKWGEGDRCNSDV
jgi:hypothetical protein